MSLDRFELLELRRDGGIQTYHARELATARPVQVHLFAAGLTAENLVLFRKIDRLPDSERRRILDRGASRGVPFVVTDRLAGYADFREWLTSNAAPSPNPTLDEQFLQLFDPPPGYPPAISGIQAPDTPAVSRRALEEPGRLLPVAAKSLAGLVLGVLTALLVLAMVVAYLAFRPI